ncbi:hypothetical protein M0804_008054 [Polistes exclamans]|nr:hypothetical protein M0804_008054 [Polistes exclamans]
MAPRQWHYGNGTTAMAVAMATTAAKPKANGETQLRPLLETRVVKLLMVRVDAASWVVDIQHGFRFAPAFRAVAQS